MCICMSYLRKISRFSWKFLVRLMEKCFHQKANMDAYAYLILPWLIGTAWLCYNTNTRPSFSNSRPSFWFSLKPSKARPSVLKSQPSVSKAQLSVSKAWPHVLKQMLGRVFWATDISRVLMIWSVKSSLHTSNNSPELLQSFRYLLSILKFSI